MSEKTNWKYDYAKNQEEIKDNVNIWEENSPDTLDKLSNNSLSVSQEFKDKYLNYGKLRKDASFWKGIDDIDIKTIQRLAFDEETDTKWVDFNLLKTIVEQLQKLMPIKEVIQAIMKGVQTVVEILSQIEKLIRYFAGFLLNLLSPWIAVAREIVSQIRRLLKDILDALFKFNLIGSSALLSTFMIPQADDADVPLVTDSQKVYDTIDNMVYNWKNRPTSKNSAHGLVFLPLGNAGIPSKGLSKLAKSADKFKKDLRAAADPEAWTKKENKFSSGAFKAAKKGYTDIYDTIETVDELIGLFKTKFFSPEVDETIKGRAPIKTLNDMQEKLNKLIKPGLNEYNLSSNLLFDGVTKQLRDTNTVKLSTPQLNDFIVELLKYEDKLKVTFNGPRNNDLIIHRLYFKLREVGSEFGEELIPVYINPRTYPLEYYSLMKPIIQSFGEDMRSMGSLYQKYGSWTKGTTVGIGEEGSIWKTIINIDYDYFKSTSINDKQLIFLREIFLQKNPDLLKERLDNPLYGGSNLFNYSGAGLELEEMSDGNDTTELYKPRYNLDTGNSIRNEVTPWEFTINFSQLHKDIVKQIKSAIREVEKDIPEGDRKQYLYLCAEVLPGNATLFDNTFFDTTIATSDMYPAYWNIGDYGAYDNRKVICHEIINELEKPPAIVSDDQWYGYSISGASIEDILKTMAPQIYDTIDDMKKSAFDFLDYLDSVIDAMEDTLENLKSLLNQVADIIKYINSDWLLNILKMLNELFFEDTPALMFAIWDGPASDMSTILKNGIASRGIQESIAGGMVIYTESAAILGILEILNVINKVGNIVVDSDREEVGYNRFIPSGPMAPSGFSMNPFSVLDISPPAGYNKQYSEQSEIVAGKQREDYPTESFGTEINSEFYPDEPPTTIEEAMIKIKKLGIGIGNKKDFHDISMDSTISII